MVNTQRVHHWLLFIWKSSRLATPHRAFDLADGIALALILKVTEK